MHKGDRASPLPANRPDRSTADDVAWMYLSRTIIDRDGVRWLVCEIAPVAPTPTLEPLRLRYERRRPWLAFESEHGAVRELVPVPDDWPRCGDVVLLTWLDRAAPLNPAHTRRQSDPALPPATDTRSDVP